VAVVEAFRAQNPRWFEQFVASSRGWTRAIVEALHQGDPATVLRGLAMHRRLLLELGEHAGLLMETASMEALARAGSRYGVAKQSGSGGGDCGVLVLRSPGFLQQASAALRSCGLIELALSLPAPGVSAVSRPRVISPAEL
jgi:phosphomevalonate kinase